MQAQVAAEKYEDLPWMADMVTKQAFQAPLRAAAQTGSNIRAVSFIAKPEKGRDLMACANGPLLHLLGQIDGFSGAMILRSHKESRSVMMLTFWTTESHATRTCWEEFPSARKLLSPLVDVYTKVQTFQATVVDGEANGKAGAKATAALGNDSY
jgi:heme-degrading monooxygenase HmoA